MEQNLAEELAQELLTEIAMLNKRAQKMALLYVKQKEDAMKAPEEPVSQE